MQKLTPLSGEKGSALVFALVFGIVLSIMGVVALKLVAGGSSGSARDIAVIKSFWANEGALMVGFRYLNCVGNLPTANISPFTVTPQLILNNDTPTVTISVVTSGTCYSCSASTNMSAVNLVNHTAGDSFTIYDWTRFTMFQSQTSGDVWELAVINGDFHTNGYINTALQMTDSIHVTGQASASSRIHPTQNVDESGFPVPYQDGFRIYDNVKDVEVTSEVTSWFQGRIPNYAFIDSIPTSVVSSNASSLNDTDLKIATSTSIDSVGVYLNGTNVTVWNHNTSTGWSSNSYAISSISGRILITQKPTYVWGTLNQALTIVTDSATGGAAHNDIIVGANILYSNTNLSTSTNVLGLVSSNNLVFNMATNNSTLGMKQNFNDSNVTVYASVFLSNGQLEVTDTAAYTALHNINFYGGVLLNNQSRGTVNPTTDHGLAALYYQDPRFLKNTLTPPGIPTVACPVDPEQPNSWPISMYLFSKGTWTNSVSHM
jgi:Tfp pilus assembly protein PilX